MTLTQIQQLNVQINVEKAPDIIGGLARIKSAREHTWCVVDIRETWQGTVLTLMLPNGYRKEVEAWDILDLETPDGRLMKGVK